MLIEATAQPIRYRLQSGVEVLLRPGVPTELTDEAGRQLLKKAGGKVRVVVPVQQVGFMGQIVTWESPLFGLLSATVQEDLPHGVRVMHPLTEKECVIPLTWLRPDRVAQFSMVNPEAGCEQRAFTIKKANQLKHNDITKPVGCGVPSFLKGMGSRRTPMGTRPALARDLRSILSRRNGCAGCSNGMPTGCPP